MANYTAHYHLHQWEPEDSFLRGDFNEDFQKIDAGLAGRGDCSLLFGSYVGTGTCGPSEPTVLTLGIPAKALWVSCGSRHAVFLRGNTQAVNFSTSDGELLEVEWTQDGLSWKLGGGLYNHDYQQLNEKGTTYYYAALYQESKEAPGHIRGRLAFLGFGDQNSADSEGTLHKSTIPGALDRPGVLTGGQGLSLHGTITSIDQGLFANYLNIEVVGAD